MSEQAQQEGNRLVTWREFARRINDPKVIEERGDWAGLCMPIEGMDLVLEPRYPYQGLGGDFWKREHESKEKKAKPEPEDDELWEVVNDWWSDRLRTAVIIIRNKATGKLEWMTNLRRNQQAFLVNTMMASNVWPLEAERKALDKLGSLISHHMFLSYLLTGCFLETSKRSKVRYMFRKLRPTLAIVDEGNGTRLLCGLCLHPIGYYQDSWAGVMCPTDEVVAHLCMMRGDEKKFWANANQHPPDHPGCGA